MLNSSGNVQRYFSGVEFLTETFEISMQSWFYIYDDWDSVCLTSRTSARCLLQTKKTYFVLSEMTLRRKHLAAAVVLIIVIQVFSVKTLKCHRTEYQIGNECCPMCPPGSRVKTDCTQFRSTVCHPCEHQTFLDKPNGRRQCQRCTDCDSGSGLTVKWPCSPAADTVCGVMEGFFCIDSEGGGCRAAQRHKRCEPGQYIREKGTSSSDTECSDCSRGTFSDGTFSSCQTHTRCETKNLQLIKEGTTSADAECGEKSSETPVVAAIVGSILGFLVVAGTVLVVLVVIWRKMKSELVADFRQELVGDAGEKLKQDVKDNLKPKKEIPDENKPRTKELTK